MAESKASCVMPSEQETTISYSRDLKTADVWTSDTTVMTKLDKLCESSPENYKCIETGLSLDGKLANKRYIVRDKKLITFRKANNVNMTDEHRAKLSEHMKRLRNPQSAIDIDSIVD